MNLKDYEPNTIFLDTRGFLWYICAEQPAQYIKSKNLRLIPNVECVSKSKEYLCKLPFPSYAHKSGCMFWGWDRRFTTAGKNSENNTILEKEISKEEYPEYFL